MTKISTQIEQKKPRAMCLDMAYTLKMVKERGLEQEFLSRECGGYFEHVWGVHPVADIPENKELTYEGFKVLKEAFSENQTIIEGSSAYYAILKYFFPLNFIVSQIRFVLYLISLVKREKISIILSTDPHFSGLIGLCIKMFTKAKLVIWVVAHNDDIFKSTGQIANPRLFRKRWVEKIVERLVFRNSDLVAGGNRNNLEFALNNGAKVNKSTIFPNGKLINLQHQVDPGLRDFDNLFSIYPAKYYFIYIGRMIDIKFPDDVLRAFSLINSKILNSGLIMAGNGAMQDELRNIAMELGISEKVHFLGNVNQSRLASLLAGCFAVLSPLTGRSLIEAALGGIPIVAYDRDWQLEFVETSGAGVIVPFRDWKKMAEVSIYLINNPDVAKKHGRAARAAGLEICDLEKLYGHEKNEFNKLLKSR